MNKKENLYFQTDLIVLLILFMVISFVSIYNAQQFAQYAGENFVLRQVVWYGAGILMLVGIQFLDLRQIYSSSTFCYLIGILVLILLNISPESIAPTINSAQSWFRFGPITLQPSEIVKITTIMFLAAAISKHKSKHNYADLKTDILLLFKILIIGITPVFFIIMQPDFGTAMVYLFITGVFVFLAGIDWKIIAVLIAFFAVFGAGLLGLILQFPDTAQTVLPIAGYQIDRIETWVDNSSESNEGYHITRSLLAIGSGQLTGKGIDNLEVYIPEAQTDFIFAVIGESFGFIGSALVILLYFLLIYKLAGLGLKTYEVNDFGAYLCFGYLALIFIHTFQNVGMTIGIMPITGIPLLLISYGGSSIMASMLGFGLIYKVSYEKSVFDKYLFK